MNNMHSFLSLLFKSPIHHLTTVVLVMLVALASSSFAFGGEIYEAARKGNLAKTKTLLKGNPDLVFSKDNKGLTPLHHAAFNGHQNLVELLLANKAEVNAKTTNGMTPLHLTAKMGYRDVAELLRQHGGHE